MTRNGSMAGTRYSIRTPKYIHHKHRHLALTLICALLLIISTPDKAGDKCDESDPTCADTPQQFHLEPGDATSVLTEYSSQAGLQLLFDFNVVKHRHVDGLDGTYTPKEALKRLLTGTGLVFDFVNPRTLAVTLPGAPVPSPSGTPEKHGLFAALKRILHPQPKQKTDSSNRSAETPQVIIAGLRSLPTQTDAPAGAEIMTFSRADLDGPGRTTLEDFVVTLPQVFGGGPSDHTYRGVEAISNFTLGTGVNLRGQDASATGVRLNGMPLPGSGSLGAFTDITAIPQLIVDHIDIVPDGASVRYDGASVGGIFNIITRPPSHSIETNVLAGTGIGGLRTKEVSLFGGDTWELNAHPTGVIFGVDYYDRTSLPADTRLQATQDLRALGGSDWRSTSCAPGTIFAGNQSWAIPAVPPGTLTASQLVPGSVNRCNLFAGTDVLPGDQRISGFLRGNVTFSADLDLWAEALVSDRRVHKNTVPYSATISVPSNNPFYVSPVGDGAPVSISYNFGHDLGPIDWSTDTVTGVFASGLAWHLAHNWDISAYLEYADVDAQQDVKNLVDFGVLSLLLNDPQSTYDPYASSNPQSDVNFFRAESRFRADSGLTTGEVSATGPIVPLPGGKASLTVGVQFRNEQLLVDSLSPAARSPFSNPPVDSRSTFSRTVASYFSELEVPIVGDENKLPGITALTVSGGIRRERYNDVGGVTIAQLGLSWSPLTVLRVRGTWSESFVPPPLPSLSESGNLSAVFPLPDPHSPTGMTTALVWTGGNTTLRPERAREWSFGLDFNPPVVPVKLSVTYFKIDFSDRILPTSFLANDLLTNPVDSFRVIRDPTPAQISEVCAHSEFRGGAQASCGTTSVGALIDLRTLNAAKLATRGLDLGSRYTYKAGSGTFTAALDGTYLLAYDLQNSPDSPVLPLRNTAEEPLTLKVRGSLDWQYGRFGTGVAVNYASEYRDITSVPNRNVSSWTTIDVQLRVRLMEGASRGNDLDLRLDAQNVGNSSAPFFNNPSGVGYDPENGMLNGRIVTARLEKRW